MTDETEDRYARARASAMRAMASIREMVARMEHADDCDGEDCDLEPADLGGMDSDEYHDSESARLSIEESALSVEVRGGWHSPGDESEDEEFMILLATGGPALRIVGELGRWLAHWQPRLEMQDWWIPWQEVALDYEDYAALRSYCECFRWDLP